MLKRTLTIFEAVYLNSSLFQEIFTLNPEGTYNESFPTLEQAETFFKTSLRLRDIKNRKSLDKKRLVEGLENNDLLGDNAGSLHEKDPFYRISYSTLKANLIMAFLIKNWKY